MKFAVVSDVHGEQHQDWSQLVFQRMGARDLDFVAFLGDICTSTGDSWERWFRPLTQHIRCPILACRGNHDDRLRWRDWFGPGDFAKTFPDVRCVFWDSHEWKHDGAVSRWLRESCGGPEKYKFLFTHLTPRIGHWCYGLGPNRSRVLIDVCREQQVTACFTGHMHGFDCLQRDGTMFLICGGGGGGRHDDFPVMHRSNFYLLVDCGDGLNVTVCQQHRDREELHPMNKWINETRREAF